MEKKGTPKHRLLPKKNRKVNKETNQGFKIFLLQISISHPDLKGFSQNFRNTCEWSNNNSNLKEMSISNHKLCIQSSIDNYFLSEHNCKLKHCWETCGQYTLSTNHLMALLYLVHSRKEIRIQSRLSFCRKSVVYCPPHQLSQV